MQKLDGSDVPKLTDVPMNIVTNETIKPCKEGTWKEMSEGCDVFQPAISPNAGWFESIYSKLTPEVGMQAALVGRPD